MSVHREHMFVGAGFACVLTTWALHCLVSFDAWFHLSAGRYIWTERLLPKGDPFSFTRHGVTWVDHEWLYQLGLAAIHAMGGWDLAITVKTSVLLSAFVVVVLGVTPRQPVWGWAVAVLAVMIGAERFILRPQTISLLFTAISLVLLLRYRHSSGLWIWWLVPLQLVWVNVHGYFVIGIILTTIVLGSSRLLAWLIPDVSWWTSDRIPWVDERRLWWVLVSMVSIVFINPYGWRAVWYPVQAVQFLWEPGYVASRAVSELQSLPYWFVRGRMCHQLGYWVLAALAIVPMCLRPRRASLSLFMVFGLVLFLSLDRLRHLDLYALVGCAIAIHSWDAWLAERQGGAHARAVVAFRWCSWVGVCCAVLLCAGVWMRGYYGSWGDPRRPGFGIAQDLFPEGAVAFVSEAPVQGPLFHNFSMGGYVLAQTYPRHKVFVDGRTELYEGSILGEYVHFSQDQWEEWVSRYGLEAALVGHAVQDALPLIEVIYNSPQWVPVYFDSSGIVFVRRNGPNDVLAQTRQLDLGSMHFAADLDTVRDQYRFGMLGAVFPSAQLNQGRVLMHLNLHEAALSMYQAALTLSPDVAAAHNNIGVIYGDMGRYELALEHFERAIALSETDPSVERNRVAAEVGIAQRDAALDVATQVIDQHPEWKHQPAHLGRMYLSLQLYPEAETVFREMVSAETTTTDGWQGLGLALYHERQLLAAVESFQRALSVANTERSADIWVDLGSALGELHRYEDAIHAFDEALMQNPTHVRALMNRSSTLGRLHRWEMAVAGFQSVLAVVSDHSVAEKFLNEALRQLKAQQ